MAYDKYTWQTGEVITAEKLNHIEDGIADMEGGGSSGADVTIQFTVDESSGNIDDSSVSADKNYEELKALDKAPLLAKVILTTDDGDGYYMRYDNWIFLVDAYYGQDFLRGYIFLSGLTGTNVNDAIYSINLPVSGGIRVNKLLTFKGGAYVPQS